MATSVLHRSRNRHVHTLYTQTNVCVHTHARTQIYTQTPGYYFPTTIIRSILAYPNFTEKNKRLIQHSVVE